MKISLLLITGAISSMSFSLQARPATTLNQDVFREEQGTAGLIGIEVRNFEHVRLGRVKPITAGLLNAPLPEI